MAKPHSPQAHRGNICWNCRRAAGGCSWSGLDPETLEPAFQPVPGWTAETLPYIANGCKLGTTYRITACPLFLPDPPRGKSVGEMELEDLHRIMRREKQK